MTFLKMYSLLQMSNVTSRFPSLLTNKNNIYNILFTYFCDYQAIRCDPDCARLNLDVCSLVVLGKTFSIIKTFQEKKNPTEY